MLWLIIVGIGVWALLGVLDDFSRQERKETTENEGITINDNKTLHININEDVGSRKFLEDITTVYCKSCGYKLDVTDQFCSDCGEQASVKTIINI